VNGADAVTFGSGLVHNNPVDRGISIVCVFNNEDVRRECLDRSIAGFVDASEVEYLPVTNTDNRFTTAGAALNFGARSATRDVVLFVHQDVYLHSLDLLKAAADLLRSGQWGVLGAVGIGRDGAIRGRLRDRVVLIGDDSPHPVEVDSLDEVLFMVSRDVVLRQPLSESPDLAWHAYGVEYCVRMRELGSRAGALNLGITHNSLTINLNRLDVAHRAVAELYPDRLPVRTTCGVVGDERIRRRLPGPLSHHTWRYRWLKESRLAWRLRKHAPRAEFVLADIRIDVDLITGGAGDLSIINIDDVGGFTETAALGINFHRYDQQVTVRVGTLGEVADALQGLGASESLLISNLTPPDIRTLAPELKDRAPGSTLIGLYDDDVWLLLGPAATVPPVEWTTPRATPLAMRSAPRPARTLFDPIVGND
jgi:hypothetical protein